RNVTLVPAAEGVEGVDAGRVTIVPGDVQPPRPVQPGVLDAQWRRASRPGPHLLAAITKAAARGARASPPEGDELEPGHVPVGEGDGDRLVPDHVDARRLVAILHGPTLPHRAPLTP